MSAKLFRQTYPTSSTSVSRIFESPSMEVRSAAIKEVVKRPNWLGHRASKK